MNTDSRRFDSLPQSGQLARASISLIERSFSKVLEHMLHVYSYIGIDRPSIRSLNVQPHSMQRPHMGQIELRSGI